MTNNVDRLARLLNGLDQRVKDLARAPQLGNSSFQSGPGQSIEVINPGTGNPEALFGTAPDGSQGAYPLTGPIPPTPSTPSASGGPGTLTVAWDGLFLNDQGAVDAMVVAPLDFTYVEVHASEDPDFTAEYADTLISTIVTPRGAAVTVTVTAGDWFVRLVSRSAPGKASPASPVATATVTLPADMTAVQDELDRMNNDLDQAADDIIAVNTRIDGPVTQAINDAAASPVTDARIQPGTLTVWPFQENVMPPGTVGQDEIRDFSIAVRKLNDRRHHLY